ncbi:hypothetical protein Scep_014999 [Stephania cephalantha]|uniref:Polygalacturonase inhibitor protein n=1 Tax=Stephania cephalantha TaxID=152367 RepID=A0AAP0J493_9MAGN
MASLLILIASLLTLLLLLNQGPRRPRLQQLPPRRLQCPPQNQERPQQSPYIIINWQENGNRKDWCCIECDDATHRVTSLDIAANIPAAIGDLPYLTSLTLRKLPNLTGPIPPSITNLKKLTFLRLDYNSLTGPVPHSSPSSGTSTTSASPTTSSPSTLGRNRLTGDASMLFGSKKGAYVIDISRNLLEFDFSKVRISKQLTNLDISHNRIYGSLPRS